jgi:hypothetical protein
LQSDILLEPYHETKVVIKSKQNNFNNMFVKNHDSIVDRFGVFVVKGVVQFNENLATIFLANLTNQTVSLPAGLIVANLELFEENDWDIIENDVTNEIETDKAKTNHSKSNLYMLSEKQNKYCLWQPMSKRVQNLIINERSKLVAVVDTVVSSDKDDQENGKDLDDIKRKKEFAEQENATEKSEKTLYNQKTSLSQ